jgi:hypothetical protein
MYSGMRDIFILFQQFRRYLNDEHENCWTYRTVYYFI